MNSNPVKDIFYGRLGVKDASSWLDFKKGNATQIIMHELKYRNNPEIGIFLGQLMGKEMAGSGFYKDIDAIVPVPIHKSKKRQRGYNQSDFIAEGIAQSLNVQVNGDVIFRHEKTSSQTKKKRYDRWENVKSVFNVKPNVLKGINHVLLVDDVITTGATIEACGHCLQLEKKVDISIVTLARSG